MKIMLDWRIWFTIAVMFGFSGIWHPSIWHGLFTSLLFAVTAYRYGERKGGALDLIRNGKL